MKFFQWVVLWLLSSCVWLTVWGQLDEGSCTKERKAPIPLSTITATKTTQIDIKFSGTYYAVLRAKITNDGHSVVMELLSKNKDKFYVEDVASKPGEKFIFSRAEVHWPSDHNIDGIQYDMEIQLIHYRQKYGSYENALNKSDGLFKMARLYKAGWLPNLFILPVVFAITQTAHRPNVPIHTVGAFRAVFPFYDKSLFYYKEFDLTSNCQSTVIWYVYSSPVYISKSQLKGMTTIYDKNNNRITSNNGDLQPVNGREVFYKKHKLF